MERNEIKRRLDLFYKTKTRTFLQVRVGDRLFVYNGYVNLMAEDYVYFEDKKSGLMPISFCDIYFVDVSKDKLEVLNNDR